MHCAPRHRHEFVGPQFIAPLDRCFLKVRFFPMRFFSRVKISIVLLLIVVFAVSFAWLISARSTVRADSSSITLNVKSGPPTTIIKVNGNGFGASETVDLDF